ncbi:MAG TPA: CoA-transferase [Solirubrobacteraceae bacterium]|nr:CoA-transferase [Solirubrobacteraceae bacterium]
MTPSERAALMACRLGREITDGDVVGVGLGTPLALAGALAARKCHAPRSHLLVAGALDPDADLITCMRGAAALSGRTAAFVPHVLTMEMAERQAMTLQFLRPAQVDGYGNANTSRIATEDGSVRRLPGGLATADVWRILPRVVVYHTDHRERSLPAEVSFITGAGGGDPQRGTKGPTRLITDRAVFEFTNDGACLESLHPGEDLDQVKADTGFHFLAAKAIATTTEPSAEELTALEQVDPHAIRELELRATRRAAAERLAKAQEQ